MRALLYCTMATPYMVIDTMNQLITNYDRGLDIDFDMGYLANGKVVATCDIEQVDLLEIDYYKDEKTETQGLAKIYPNKIGCDKTFKKDNFLKKCCLPYLDLAKYLGGKSTNFSKIFYALHLNNVKVLKEPLNITEIKASFTTNGMNHIVSEANYNLQTPPQNMCYCYVNGERCALISIKPIWMSKIIEKEKTIEVRKNIVSDLKDLIAE